MRIHRQDNEPRWTYHTLATSSRRALGQLCREGLIACAGQLAAEPGRPKVWKITAAGRQLAAPPAFAHHTPRHVVVAGRGATDLAYVQVADDLARRIRSGSLAGRLPAERALAAGYRMSCGSIRHAMAILRERELVRTMHGRGTFATPGSGRSRQQ